MNKKIKNIKTNALSNKEMIFIFLFTFVFSILFYHNTFFYRTTIQNVDNFVFFNFSYFIKRGLIIYKDVIDNKGPLLYLFNYIMYIFDDYNLLYFSSLFIHFITNIFIFKIARLKLNNKYSYIVMVLANAYLISVAEESLGSITTTMCEFYALPIFAYVFYRYLKDDEYNKIDYIIYGICFAVLFFLRVNLASISVITTILILYKYYKNKKYKLIVDYILYFIIGVLIITLPIVIYFIKNDAFSEFINSYFLFNVKYSITSVGNSSFSSGIIRFLLVSFKTFVDFTKNVFILSILCIFIKNTIIKKKVDESFIIFVFCYFLAIFVSNRYYMHYIWVLMPLTAIPFSMVFEDNKIKVENLTIFLVILATAVFFFLYAIKHDYVEKRNDKGFSNDYKETINTIKEIVKDSDDFKVFGAISNRHYFYIDTNQLPAGDYVYQYVEDFMYDHYVESFTKERPDIVVYEIKRPENGFMWNFFLQNELKNSYSKVYDNNTYIVYLRK